MAVVNLGYVGFASMGGTMTYLCWAPPLGSGRSQIASSAGRDTTQLCRLRSLGLKCITGKGGGQGEARRECRKRVRKPLSCRKRVGFYAVLRHIEGNCQLAEDFRSLASGFFNTLSEDIGDARIARMGRPMLGRPIGTSAESVTR